MTTTSSSGPFIGVRSPTWLGDDPAKQAQDAIEWATIAEDLGCDAVYVLDRLLATVGTRDGLPVYQATMLDPFLMLSAIAARTQRIKLATLVAVLPFRHPAVLAKITASLDVLSNGRFVLGAGSGWNEAELTMLGVDPKTRGSNMEEEINLLRRLWSGESVTSDGEFWKLDDVTVSPRPVQRPGPPIWLGSFSPNDAAAWRGQLSKGVVRALERVGRVADAWVPAVYSAAHKKQLHPEQLAQGWEIVRDAAHGAGRAPDSIEFIYPHWVGVVRDDQERRSCEAILSQYFPGDFDDARATYLIGSPDEIAEKIGAQIASMGKKPDGYMFTAINDSTQHLETIMTELKPLLP